MLCSYANVFLKKILEQTFLVTCFDLDLKLYVSNLFLRFNTFDNINIMIQT